MRFRSLACCLALLFGAVLGAAGCSSPAKPPPAARPTGTVTVRSGDKVVCVIKLGRDGTGSCKVSTAGYVPGKVTYTGTYSGSAGFKSGNGSTTVTILPKTPAGPVAPSAGASAS